ncbi:MAG TPA: site-specific integrase, partial [Clostridia bacterium]|nr:site-specific integrase [Clostridia bacterium]
MLDHYIDGFIKYLAVERGLAENTMDSYYRDLKHWQKFLASKNIRNLHEIDEHKIVLYLMHLKQEGKAVTTISRHLAAIKTFYKFLLGEKIVAANPASKLETPKTGLRLPQVMTEDEVDKLLQQPDL